MASCYLIDDAGEVGELRIEEVRGERERRDRDDHLSVDPLELRELDVLDTGLREHLLLQIFEQPLVLLQRRLGRPAQRSHLETREGGADRSGPIASTAAATVR